MRDAYACVLRYILLREGFQMIQGQAFTKFFGINENLYLCHTRRLGRLINKIHIMRTWIK